MLNSGLNISKIFDKEELELSYKTGDTFFIYGDKKYYFKDVSYYKEIENTYSSGGVVDDRILFMGVKVNGDEFAINKSINVDEDYIELQNLQNELRSYRFKKLMDRYLQNQIVLFDIGYGSNIEISNETLFLNSSDQVSEKITYIAPKNDVVVFKTKNATFEREYSQISDYQFLSQTKEYDEFANKYIKRKQKQEIIESLICYPAVINSFFGFYNPSETIIDIVL